MISPSSQQPVFLDLPMAQPGSEIAVGLPSAAQGFVVATVSSPVGEVPAVSGHLSLTDRLGSWAARWNIGRMAFVVEPGLYGLGRPDSLSPVVVTANYKMSFDRLRAALTGHDCWLLVLDTKGINVWCAAGKGTFGTVEVCDRITSSRLQEVVEHRKIIVPQLGAPGVNGLAVKKHSGFTVVWGPIEARHLPAFLANGMEASPAMRRKEFPWQERLALAPVELMLALPKFFLLLLVFAMLSGLGGALPFWSAVLEMAPFAGLGLACGLVSGTVLVPLFLPWLPGRAFSLKSLWAGLFCYLILLALYGFTWPQLIPAPLEAVAWLLMATAISSWLGMNFTGSSTYTSCSGVRYEMLRAIPAQAAAGLLGFIIWLAARFWTA